MAMPMLPNRCVPRWLLPAEAAPNALSLSLPLPRALRAVGNGHMAVQLPAYLPPIGLGKLQVGIVSTATLLGLARATFAVAITPSS
ncbi:MAG: hypothetical protein AB9M60_18720 [Leptothrix sp. (in: b-proteobacteria)]